MKKVILVMVLLLVSTSWALGEDSIYIQARDYKPMTWSYNYKWFAITIDGKNIAYVDEDCKIIEIYPIAKYKYLKTELEHYSNMCKDYNELEKEFKGKK